MQVKMRSAIFLNILWGTLGVAGSAQAQGSVPAEFQHTYSELKGHEDRFLQQLNGLGPTSKTPVDYGAEFLSANCNRGLELLRPGTLEAVQNELNGLKEVGVNTVTTCISFPQLYQPYFDDPNGGAGTGHSARDFINFYQQVAKKVHAMGMRFAVETYVLLVESITPGLPNLRNYYRSLGLANYMAGRTAVALTVAQQIHPDYLFLQTEPQTEFGNTGYAAFSRRGNGSLEMVKQMLSALENANPSVAGLHSSMLVGAGIGTWNWPAFQPLIQAEAKLPDLDLLDVHLYPLNEANGTDYLANALSIVRVAQQNHKKLSMSETWPHKFGDREVGNFPLSNIPLYEVRARTAYCFWSPLDAEYFQLMSKLAHIGPFVYLSLFFDANFFGCVDYDSISPPCSSLPAGSQQRRACFAQIQRKQISAASENLRHNGRPRLAATGRAYQQVIMSDRQ